VASYMIMMDKPTLVYKFHKINFHLDELLINKELWFSHQNDLNDPYDCKYSLSDACQLSLVKKSSEKLLKAIQNKTPAFQGLTPETFFEFIKPTVNSNEFIAGIYNEMFGKLMGWRVCCFTTDPLNELMWAHYADNNKGVCLEFTVSNDQVLFEKLFPVEYNDTFPEINSMDELPEALLRKRKAWSNEAEWRLLAMFNSHQSFNKEALTSIYFGCYVPIATIDVIKQKMIKSGYSNVKFKQLEFRINGITLKPIDM
jgi:hypothetical protein